MGTLDFALVSLENRRLLKTVLARGGPVARAGVAWEGSSGEGVAVRDSLLLGGRVARAQVRESQRGRLVAAMAQVAAERGVRGATLGRVTARAGVSRATFYECFVDLQECLLAVLEVAMRGAMAAIDRALCEEGPVAMRASGAVVALLGFLEEDHALAWFWLVEALAAGPAVLEFRARELELLRHTVDAACGPSSGASPAAGMCVEAALAALLGLLHTRLLNGEAPPFLELAEPLTAVLLASSLDVAALRRVSESTGRRVRVLREQRAGRATSATSVVAIPAMLTNPAAHRARQCLLWLAERPGESNRGLAESIGVAHAGQVSALLSRMAGLGLLEKHAGRPGRPNAWRLSDYGTQVARALVNRDTREPLHFESPAGSDS